jgi:DNA repair protein RadC
MAGFDDASVKPPPHFLGHRERLKDRFREGGADAVPDYELLEMVLYRAIRRGDTKPIAKQLLARFGTFAEVISADLERLMEVKGVGEAVATELKIVHAAAMRLMKGQVINRPALSSWNAIIEYIRAAMVFHGLRRYRALSRTVSRQEEPADRRRGASGRHRRSYAGLPSRSSKADA